VPGSGLHFGARTPVAAAVPGYGAPDAFQQQWNQEDVGATGVPGVTGPTASAGTTGAADPAVGTGAGPADRDAETTLPVDAADVETTAAGTTGAANPAQPRIVQDGWEWDYAAQQWKPLQGPPPGEQA
jgi:aquaporin Z